MHATIIKFFLLIHHCQPIEYEKQMLKFIGLIWTVDWFVSGIHLQCTWIVANIFSLRCIVTHLLNARHNYPICNERKTKAHMLKNTKQQEMHIRIQKQQQKLTKTIIKWLLSHANCSLFSDLQIGNCYKNLDLKSDFFLQKKKTISFSRNLLFCRK